jgi:hypothetical protein
MLGLTPPPRHAPPRRHGSATRRPAPAPAPGGCRRAACAPADPSRRIREALESRQWARAPGLAWRSQKPGRHSRDGGIHPPRRPFHPSCHCGTPPIADNTAWDYGPERPT